jgi:hypothetical protein
MKTPAFAYDFETYLFVPGAMAPPHVCASTARVAGGDIVGSLLSHADALPALRAQLQSGETVAFANAPYDLAVAAQADPTLFPLIFKALREGRVHDVLLAQVLDSIYRGTLGDPLVDPSTGKPSKRYSLAIVTHLVLGRADAKDADAWRKSYALLDGIPVDRWPEEARVYPVHDARNTLEVAIEQVAGKPGSHSWDPVPQVPGQPLHRLVGCSHCALVADESDYAKLLSECASAPAQAHMNLGDLRHGIPRVRSGLAGDLLDGDFERVARVVDRVDARLLGPAVDGDAVEERVGLAPGVRVLGVGATKHEVRDDGQRIALGRLAGRRVDERIAERTAVNRIKNLGQENVVDASLAQGLEDEGEERRIRLRRDREIVGRVGEGDGLAGLQLRPERGERVRVREKTADDVAPGDPRRRGAHVRGGHRPRDEQVRLEVVSESGRLHLRLNRQSSWYESGSSSGQYSTSAHRTRRPRRSAESSAC